MASATDWRVRTRAAAPSEIDELVAACTRRLPTTLLTNGMLLTGTKLERLRRMDRDRLTLQISLDSPTLRT